MKTRTLSNVQNRDDVWAGEQADAQSRVAPLWPDELAEAIAWFERSFERLPRTPFTLSPGIRVADPATFYASISLDVDAGPSRVRARSGLLDDLLSLRAAVTSRGEQS